MKHFAATLLIALALSAIALWQTDGFSPQKVAIPLLDRQDEPGADPSLIPSTFRYLGRGRQAFVFESGGLVLKLFDKSDLSEPLKARLSIPTKSARRGEIRWKEKLRIYPEAYSLALNYLGEDTGVLIAHLGKSAADYPTVELVDKANRRFQIDLNRIPFILQKRGGELFYPSLTKGDLDRKIEAYLEFQKKRISLCIADHDRDIKRNYCWNDGSLQYIDPARCFYEPRLKEPERLRLEWWKGTHRLRKWLSVHAPEKIAWFDVSVQKGVEEALEKILDRKDGSTLIP